MLDERALRAKVLNMLAYKPYSEQQLRQRLAESAEPSTIESVIEEMKRKRFINDEALAQGIVNSQKSRMGPRKLQQKLQQKGLEGHLEGLLDTDESLRTAIELLERHTSRHKGDKERALRFLINKGFGFGQALEAWQTYLEQQSDML